MANFKVPKTPEEKFILYRDGWIDGASFLGIRHPDRIIYLSGYQDGREAVIIALGKARIAFGYEPKYLRNTDEST